MDKKEIIDISTDCLQYLDEIVKESGVPGIALVGRFTKYFVDLYLRSRFQEFVNVAGVDVDFLKKIVTDENYSNCLYSALETVRRTHSKIGLTVLALIYKDYCKNPDFLIPAMRAFAEISDKTIKSFICLYESIPEGEKFLKLSVLNGDEIAFHDNYIEAVELINRNIFVQSAHMIMSENVPIEGMIVEHTKKYYEYCKEAISFLTK